MIGISLSLHRLSGWIPRHCPAACFVGVDIVVLPKGLIEAAACALPLVTH